MADSAVQPVVTLKVMEREYKSKTVETTNLFETLLKLLKEKEEEVENLKYDLQDQTESRREWQKRATDAETRLASVQHILVLIDGNQTFFRPKLIRSGAHGAKEAVEKLITEAKASAREQHKNDLPEHLSVIVHIFIDVGKLADDLSTSNLLPEPDQLWTFIQEASKNELGVTITDCGAGHQAVDAKMKYFYELYLENCHCRHLFLALGRQSDYYTVLATYADDEYTKAKTSLIKPAQGLPQSSLPLHTVEFSTLESVHRQVVSFNDATPLANGWAPPASQPDFTPRETLPQRNGGPPAALRAAPSLNPMATQFQARPTVAPAAAFTSDGGTPKTNGDSSRPSRVQSSVLQGFKSDSITLVTPQPAPASVSSAKAQPTTREPMESAALPLHTAPAPQDQNNRHSLWEDSTTMLQTELKRPPELGVNALPDPVPVAAYSSPAPAATSSPMSQAPANQHIEPTSTTHKADDSSSAGVIKLDTSSHSSHQSTKGAEQGWETATTNSYVPAPISVPWGEEEPLSQSVSPQFNESPSYSKKPNNNFNRRQPKQGGNNSFAGGGKDRSNGSHPGRRVPRQFEGSWDDMVASESRQSQGSSTSPRPATVSISSATNRSTEFANAFARQVVAEPEPHPQARPIVAPIALNKSNQRIDLKLPKPAPADEEAFKLRTNNRHLCNEHHMRGSCTNIQCPFDHEEISDGLYLVLRNKARHSPCNQGSDCRRHDCYFAHHCPNVSRVSDCGRPACPFKYKGLHDILDLDIVEMIEPPKEEELVEGLI
ncbi:hypothetical protein H2200_002829 [Cladophialophora chaetospira]|uniref:C3H1-type domain-containing protein n=1 Tax=Cladophialophora chaetospira TaxID=386627 RepID=A0AA39CM59_9EURO|nr:hypothetical protein H2200_002829 [Cladophialophora chaetospira]